MTRKLFIFIAFLTLAACNNPNTNSDKKPFYKTPSNRGIIILSDGPRGSGYTDSEGSNFHFRIFRAHIINDTIIPIDLTVNFSGDSVPLLPGADKYVRVFLFPDTMTPESAMREYNFGVSGIDHFLSTCLNKPTAFAATLQPKEECFLYIGALVNTNGVAGLARGKLAFKGEEINISLAMDLDTIVLPADSIKSNIENKGKIGLVFGLGIDPPDNYALISCGQIVFKN